MSVGTACPCGRTDARGRATAYEACCGRYLDHDTPAPDAECLMRSRYSAFVLDRRAYLLATWHPDTRPEQLGPPEPGLRWLGLDVKHHQPIDADHATVEFIARSKLGGKAHRLHETSRFVREGGLWFYIDGDFTDTRGKP